MRVFTSPSHTIHCPSYHIHCLTCLRDASNRVLQSKTIPVCHQTRCNYPLSRYDVTCLPLDRDTITRLLACVQTLQRPQCPLCLFYVEFNTMSDFEEHVAACNAPSLAPCESCHSLHDLHQLRDHEEQCHPRFQHQKDQQLTEFIQPRTKYPLTAIQIRFFIGRRRRTKQPLNPRSIVDSLADLSTSHTFRVILFLHLF